MGCRVWRIGDQRMWMRKVYERGRREFWGSLRFNFVVGAFFVQGNSSSVRDEQRRGARLESLHNMALFASLVMGQKDIVGP